MVLKIVVMKKNSLILVLIICFFTGISNLYGGNHPKKTSQLVSKFLEVKNEEIRGGQEIIVYYSGLPGNSQDWITIVERDKPDNTFGQWFYTQGNKSGSHTFNGIPEGIYEIRVYFDWPDGKYEVKDRLVVNVGGNYNIGESGFFKYNLSGYNADQPIEIEFINLPGNKQDWITLVQKDKPENTFGQWFYTDAKKNGTHVFNGMPAGTYELRVYFNWPDGKFEVMGRETIIIK